MFSRLFGKNKLKTILIIEDDDSLLKLYKAKFKKEGFKVLTANNGLKGLELSYKERPDMIFLDILFPGEMSGIEILKILKKHKATKNIPVFLLSNISENETMNQCFSLGARGYFIKAFHTIENITASIKQFL
ncbi:MAG: response regulator [Planctomycetes bacterium]|jgi:DNA-binding response OmpR family regulator|nr:response regulator [Planctomycetota bacterium]